MMLSERRLIVKGEDKKQMNKTYLLTAFVVIFSVITFFQSFERAQGTAIAAFYPPEIFYRDKVAVLMYHHIDEVESGATITRERFEEHLDYLLYRGYSVISLSHFRSFLRGEAEVPPNAVLITFDDGYESFYQYAYPLLKERGMSATVFMIVRHIGARYDQIPKIDWHEMARMIESGMYFQSHSYDSHFYAAVNAAGNINAALVARIYFAEEVRTEAECRAVVLRGQARQTPDVNWRNETEAEHRARVYEDLRNSRVMLERRLGVRVDVFSAPYGIKNAVVDEIAQEAGFDYIFTIAPGLVSAESDPMSLPRINAGSPTIDGKGLHDIILRLAAGEQ